MRQIEIAEKACPDNDFLLRRCRIFKIPSWSLLQSLFQVIITSFFSGSLASVYPGSRRLAGCR
jgi:hypothetical protein